MSKRTWKMDHVSTCTSIQNLKPIYNENISQPKLYNLSHNAPLNHTFNYCGIMLTH